MPISAAGDALHTYIHAYNNYIRQTLKEEHFQKGNPDRFQILNYEYSEIYVVYLDLFKILNYD